MFSRFNLPQCNDYEEARLQQWKNLLVLYTPRAGRALPAGEGGCAAGSLPPSLALPPQCAFLDAHANYVLGSATPTTSNLDLQCGADRHPSSPFALSGSSVGQRGISAQTVGFEYKTG
jgi:hypothetical protein